MNKLNWFLLTGFYSGLLPKAPGTWGSIVGVIIAYLVIAYMPNPNMTIMLLAALFSIIGFKLVNEYEANGGIHDDKRIVIDEIAGVLITIGVLGDLKHDTFIKLLLAFISFRLFDIWKPSIIGKIDQKAKGGLGVMGDDILAGIFGGIFAGILYMGYLKLKTMI
ncbi:phosphatidylglycerophosphatase A [Caminibacter pacificus]|uniref:Phosphatidylglycerophosphatase n=1 Tax=Caminibacter pacificus TaxID=1424653 RepID=A0AAJ4RDN1_9BACT|nr:phosphatidylglycerophosphatase A [Caminibacter pacificus]QCI28607.1 phosphatidylglycerophosphatase A [Caminibacter pacificus]ROR40664.1 phosphatidylglycerophosphatase [Caminibacter pacificus]